VASQDSTSPSSRGRPASKVRFIVSLRAAKTEYSHEARNREKKSHFPMKNCAVASVAVLAG
jgi:hypothetical protein